MSFDYVGDDPNYFNTSTTSIPQDITAPQGWVCPKCGRIYSPSTPMCYYCGGNDTQIYASPNTTGVNPEKWWKDYITCCNPALEKILNSSEDIFRIHPEDGPIYEVGGSDYWDEVNKTWTNIPYTLNNLQKELNEIKSTFSNTLRGE